MKNKRLNHLCCTPEINITVVRQLHCNKTLKKKTDKKTRIGKEEMELSLFIMDDCISRLSNINLHMIY